MRTTITVLGLLIAIVTTASAQTTPSCSSERAHEFDFWIGEWEVLVDGEIVGRNTISPMLDGCVLQESWRGNSGSAGASFNFYNPQIEKWQQFWVWRNGTTLYLTGDFADGKMVLEGVSTRRDGTTVLNRITWYDNDDGTVRQHWEVSQDGGESWTTSFDGLYRPVDDAGS